MCTKIGRLYRYSKWTNKLPLTMSTKNRMFSIRPPTLCEHTFQAAGMRLVTSRMMTIIEKSERRKYNTATYENVRDAGRANNVWIIDVRHRKDVEMTGCIKNSVNIPLQELEAALQFTPEYFFNRYGVTKPYIDSAIIFSCRTGRLSKVAYELAESMGYKNLKNFDGGYLLYESLCANMSNIATFEDVKGIKPDEYLIDVRNPDELEETGSIPHSINIPLKELAHTFDLSEEDFKKKVGSTKPQQNDRIIVTCSAGSRSENGALQLTELQYTNVTYYKGGWDEWVVRAKRRTRSSDEDCM